MFSFVRNDNYPSHWWHIFFKIVLPVYGIISLQPAVCGLCFDKLSLMSWITYSCRWNVGKSDDRQKPPKLQGLSILILKEDLYVLRFVSCFWIHHFQKWVFNKLLNKFIISTVCAFHYFEVNYWSWCIFDFYQWPLKFNVVISYLWISW